MIRAQDGGLYSKFIDGEMRLNGDDHGEGKVPISFNCNTNITVLRFWSDGSEKNPPFRSLTCTYNDWTAQGAGYDSCRGTIGEGRIYLNTGKGVVIKGKMEVMEGTGQVIVGSGTWSKLAENQWRWRNVITENFELKCTCIAQR
ncbi:Aa1-PRI4 [Mycena vulgaris]|nr:Aa1-PRI4 [Mycena vulgaris]